MPPTYVTALGGPRYFKSAKVFLRLQGLRTAALPKRNLVVRERAGKCPTFTRCVI